MSAPIMTPHQAAERSFQAQSKNKQDIAQKAKPQITAPPTLFSINAPRIPMPAQTSIHTIITAIAMKLAKNNNSILFIFFVFLIINVKILLYQFIDFSVTQNRT